MLSAQTADVYTDFNGFADLKNQARKNSPEALKAVAKQFEALFLNNVLKGMRNAKLADGIMDNEQSKFYNEMYDQQLAVHLSAKPGVGLADLIVRQLSPKQAGNEKPEIEAYQGKPATNPVNLPQSSLRAVAPVLNNQVGSGVNTDTAGSPMIINTYQHNGNPLNEMIEIPMQDDSAQPIQSADDFIQKLLPYAQQASQDLGVDPKVLLAQAALESGWGRSVIKHSNGVSSFNLFNIKADRSWQGKQTQVSTLEFEQGVAKKVNAGFRSYTSFQESFQDYVDFIKSNPRYGDALKQVSNSGRYLQELQQAGYATDPNYANKVMSIYRGNTMAGADSDTLLAMQ